MSNDLDKIIIGPTRKHGTMASYGIGFVLSIVLTLLAYFCVTERLLTGWTLISTISVLAILQMCVQLLFFIHLEGESQPHWNLMAFLFMVLVVILLVGGSLWIMYSLENRVMPSENMKLMKHSKELSYD